MSRCIEMMEKKPWTYQIDLFGLCSVVHCMLHGKYMEVVKDHRTGLWRPKEAFKRYWQSEDLWKPLFNDLLNIAKVKYKVFLPTNATTPIINNKKKMLCVGLLWASQTRGVSSGRIWPNTGKSWRTICSST